MCIAKSPFLGKGDLGGFWKEQSKKVPLSWKGGFRGVLLNVF
jgi:hypothetical protein